MKFSQRFNAASGVRVWLRALVLGALLPSPLYAEDTEIYRPAPTAIPYVMLLLDTSGSMSGGIADAPISETNPQRMATMKAALHRLLDESETGDNYHIGLARYTSPGGSILYPVSRLGDPASVDRAFVGATPADDFMPGATFVNNGVELSLSSATSTTAGVRIANIGIPRGAQIESATLVLTTNNTYTGTAQLSARVAQQGNVPAVLDQAAYDALVWSEDVASSAVIPEAGLQNQMAIAIDVTSQLNTRLLASDWAAGNALMFQVQAVSGTVGVFSAEGAVAVPRSDGRLLNQYRPHLFVKYQVLEGNAYGARPTTVRDALRGVVDLMPTIGDTPLIGAYFETAQYMQGNAVAFGLNRGTNNWRALMRVSNLDSLSAPATLTRSAMCTDVALNSRACMSESISGAPEYQSPLSVDCSVKPAIVMLTDGEPNNERCPGDDLEGEESGELRCDLRRVSDVLNALPRNSDDATCDPSNDWDCGIKLSRVLANPSHYGLNDQPPIPTYTISFGEGLEGAAAHLTRLARGGHSDDPPDEAEVGAYFQADDGEALSEALASIFGSVASGIRLQAGAGVSVDRINRAQHTDQLYFALFEPKNVIFWPGNLKRYRLGSDGEIYGQGASPAVDSFGNFVEASRSFWSSENDGFEIAKGGAVEQLATNRNILTHLVPYPDSFDSDGEDLVRLEPSMATNAAHAATLQSLLETSCESDGDGNVPCQGVLNWLVRDDASRPKVMGSPLHSRPLVVSYAADNSRDVVFLSTNQGLLHAVDTENGQELFSFLPRELLKNQHRFMAAEGGNLVYGLDAPWVAYRYDENANGVVDADDFVYLYGGMRGGGRNYYALDVTRARSGTNQAKLRFALTPETRDGTQTPFSGLGQTWSVPVLSRFANSCAAATPKADCTSRVVVVFGGGYDYASHEKTGDEMPRPTRDAMGAGLYIVDAASGDLLWRAGGTGSGADTIVDGMDFSITSTIRMFDRDYDGFADHLYAVDLGGQVLRFDMAKDEHNRGMARIASAKVIAELGGTDSALARDFRRFYDAPAITPMRDSDGKRWVSIAVGSGYRSHPTDTQTEEMFFMLRDDDPYKAAAEQRTSPIGVDDLQDVSVSPLPEESETGLGWYIKLDRTGPAGLGEKVVGEPIVLNENLLFTTYVPPRSSAVQCQPEIGHMALYGVKLRSSAPALPDFNNDGELDRYKDEIMPGLVGGIAFIQSAATDLVQLLTGTQPTPFDPAYGKNLIKTRWRSNETEVQEAPVADDDE